jgi:hypothetical protein
MVRLPLLGYFCDGHHLQGMGRQAGRHGPPFSPKHDNNTEVSSNIGFHSTARLSSNGPDTTSLNSCSNLGMWGAVGGCWRDFYMHRLQRKLRYLLHMGRLEARYRLVVGHHDPSGGP